METVIRGAVIYLFCLLVFRVAGRRALTEVTSFDFVLLLIISETTQQAMIGHDQSVTAAMLLITTLVFLDIVMSLLKRRFRWLERAVESIPLILVEDGKPLPDRLHRSRVDEQDILAAARDKQGLQRMDQIQYAVLERSGGIAIIPKPESSGSQ